MEAMRQSWTDERLDDGFDRISSDIQSVRGEVASVRGEVTSLRREVKSDLDAFRTEVNARFDGLQRTLLQVGGGVIAALIGVIATQL